MKKIFLIVITGFLYTISSAQIRNLEEERSYLRALGKLIDQCYSEQFNETIGTIEEDPDEANRQWLQLDTLRMNLVYYKTPYEKADEGKDPNDIIWKAKFVVPLYEIESLNRDDKKKVFTIKMNAGKNAIQTFMIMSGNEYYPATKNRELVIHSDKLMNIKNLYQQLTHHISELQKFHKKKMTLVNYLNEKLHKEVAYQISDSLNYPQDRMFKVIQEFQLDSSGQSLSLIVERENYYESPIIEKQSVMLKDIVEVVKDINIILKAGENTVIKTITIMDNNGEKKHLESADNLFFLQWCYEKNNEHIGDEIINLFKQIGQIVQKNDWYD